MFPRYSLPLETLKEFEDSLSLEFIPSKPASIMFPSTPEGLRLRFLYGDLIP